MRLLRKPCAVGFGCEFPPLTSGHAIRTLDGGESCTLSSVAPVGICDVYGFVTLKLLLIENPVSVFFTRTAQKMHYRYR